MGRPGRRTGLALALASALTTVVAAQGGPPEDIGSRAKGAATVVVATVVDVQSRFGLNDYGDRLILSDATLRVDEALKGPFTPVSSVTVEGGTIGSLALNVSDMAQLQPNERAVFFLTKGKAGQNLPYHRGAGILKLDSSNRIAGTNVTLDDVRRIVNSVR